MRYTDPLRHVMKMLTYFKLHTSLSTVTRYNDTRRHVLKILAYFKWVSSWTTVTRYNDPLRHAVVLFNILFPKYSN